MNTAVCPQGRPQGTYYVDEQSRGSAVSVSDSNGNSPYENLADLDIQRYEGWQYFDNDQDSNFDEDALPSGLIPLDMLDYSSANYEEPVSIEEQLLGDQLFCDLLEHRSNAEICDTENLDLDLELAPLPALDLETNVGRTVDTQLTSDVDHVKKFNLNFNYPELEEIDPNDVQNIIDHADEEKSSPLEIIPLVEEFLQVPQHVDVPKNPSEGKFIPSGKQMPASAPQNNKPGPSNHQIRPVAGRKRIDMQAQRYILAEEDESSSEDIDIETVSKELEPVIHADDVNSLLEQFEMNEIKNTKKDKKDSKDTKIKKIQNEKEKKIEVRKESTKQKNNTSKICTDKKDKIDKVKRSHSKYEQIRQKEDEKRKSSRPISDSNKKKYEKKFQVRKDEASTQQKKTNKPINKDIKRNGDRNIPKPEPEKKNSIVKKDVPQEIISKIKDKMQDSMKPRKIVILDDPHFLGGLPEVSQKKTKKSRNSNKKSSSMSPNSSTTKSSQTKSAGMSNSSSPVPMTISASNLVPYKGQTPAKYSPSIASESYVSKSSSRGPTPSSSPRTNVYAPQSIIAPKAESPTSNNAKSPNSMSTQTLSSNLNQSMGYSASSKSPSMSQTPVLNPKTNVYAPQNIAVHKAQLPTLNKAKSQITMSTQTQTLTSNSHKLMTSQGVQTFETSDDNSKASSVKYQRLKNTQTVNNINLDHSYHKPSMNQTASQIDKSKKIIKLEDYKKKKGTNEKTETIVNPIQINTQNSIENNVESKPVTEEKQKTEAETSTKPVKKVINFEEYKKLRPILPTSDEPKMPREEYERRVELAARPRIPDHLVCVEFFDVGVDASLVSDSELDLLDNVNFQKVRGKLTQNSLMNEYRENIKNKEEKEGEVKVDRGCRNVKYLEKDRELPEMCDAGTQTNIHLITSIPRKRRHSSSSSSSDDDFSSSNSRDSSRSRGRGCTPPRYHPRQRSPTHYYQDEEEDMANRRILCLEEVPDDIDEDYLWSKFDRYGEIKRIKMFSRNKGRKRTRVDSDRSQYAFIYFMSSESVYEAMDCYKRDYPRGIDFGLNFGGRRKFCKTEYADLDNMPTYFPQNNVQRPKNDFDSLLQAHMKAIADAKNSRKSKSPSSTS